MGWHKVELTFCFLLVALLRMAHILFNPTHESHFWIHIGFAGILQHAGKFGCTYVLKPLDSIYRFFCYQLYKLIFQSGYGIENHASNYLFNGGF